MPVVSWLLQRNSGIGSLRIEDDGNGLGCAVFFCFSLISKDVFHHSPPPPPFCFVFVNFTAFLSSPIDQWFLSASSYAAVEPEDPQSVASRLCKRHNRFALEWIHMVLWGFTWFTWNVPSSTLYRLLHSRRAHAQLYFWVMIMWMSLTRCIRLIWGAEITGSCCYDLFW